METKSLDHESALVDLISLWQRRRANGETVTAAQLCRDRPDLLPALERRIAALQQMDALAQAMHETPTVLPQSSEIASEAATIDPYATLPPDSQVPTPPLAVLSDAPAVPGYEVLGVLGKGGMGIVYKARQTKLNRLVALKMILHSYAGEQERLRFQIEAEAVARLHHPHIVQVFEVGEHQGAPYFSLEYCAGGSLADKLDGTPWDAKAAARLVETLARAMQAAHQAQVIHRDLKPGNVLLTAEGEPKVTDFGLAKKLDVQGQTQTGAIMGTPSYMAPEQASGSKDIGPAADVYALGAILYELLTGRPPFKAATALDTIMQAISQEPVSVRQLQPQMPRDVETICHKCLQKEPKKRYSSALELAEDLHRFGAGEPVAARPVSRIERSWRWCRRNPMAAGLSAALLMLLLAAALGSTVAAIHLNRTSEEARHNAELAEQARQEEAAARKSAEQKEEEAQKQKEEARRQREEAVRRREEARRNQYVAEMNLVQRDYEINNLGRARELLDAWVPQQTDSTDLRDFEWHYWQRMAHRELLILKGHRGIVTGVSFSPDGQRLASASSSGIVRVCQAATGKELLSLMGHTAGVYWLSFSPDGRRLASAGSDQTIRVWDVVTGRGLCTLKVGNSDGISFSPDGLRLAAWGIDHTVVVWEIVTGKKLHTFQGSKSRILGVSFSPDGRRLASTDMDDTVRVWDVATGKELLTIKVYLKGPSSFYGPNNQRLALVGGVYFSPDGQKLASAGGDNTVRVWEATTGKELLTLKGHAKIVFALSFSPNGRRLASASRDHTVRVWDTTTGRELLTLKGHAGEVARVAFSPDGRRLTSASDDGTILVWEALDVGATIVRRRELVSLVDSLYEKPHLRDEVLAVLRKDVTLDEADRKYAIEAAESHSEDPQALNKAAWEAVKYRNAGKNVYALALRQCEAAVRLAPTDGNFLNTLGIAQYRAGRYADTLATLRKLEKLNSTKEGSLPSDLAFLAMTQHQLDKKDEAKATLGRLRQAMKHSRWVNDAESVTFLREAEELIEGRQQ